MPDAVQTPPVFIDQMPDYQKAMTDIRALSKEPAAFQAAVEELKLGKEWQENKARLDALRPQAETLMGSQSNALENHSRAASRNATVGNVVAVGSGLTVGVLGGRRWGTIKGVLTGIAAAVAAEFVYSAVKPQPSLENDPAFTAIKEQKLQLAAKALELQQPFIETMATRMLAERKELQGAGAQMKLVSNAEPTQQTGMAAKYATAPAATNVDKVQATKDMVSGAAR